MRWLWLFVCGVTVLDVAVAWKCRECFDAWEANSAMRWLESQAGMAAVITARLATVVLAYCLIRVAYARRKSTAWAGALTILFIHLYLLGCYAAAVFTLWE